MIQILQALQLVCEQNFTLDTVNQQCTCLNFLSANKLKCVKSCEELGETLFDGRCVKAIGLKSVTTSDDQCQQKYNEGSHWDYSSGQCICFFDYGYAGPPNSFCQDCARLFNKISGETSCQDCDRLDEIPGYLSARTCQKCSEKSQIPSVDHKECVNCSFIYGTGAIFVSAGTCSCDSENGFIGNVENGCIDCWRLGKSVLNDQCVQISCNPKQIFVGGKCFNCENNQVSHPNGRSCISCNLKFGIGSIYSSTSASGCQCDTARGYVLFQDYCVDCFRTDQKDKSNCPIPTCKVKEKWDSVIQECICDSAAGFGGVRGACSCDLTKGYAGTDSCLNCWASAKMATASGCVDCPANEIIIPGSKTQCGCDSAQGYAGVSGSCSCSAPGFALTLGACVNCAQNGQIVSASGCVACPSSEKFDPSAKACVCDSTLGFVGVSGSCFCNFGAGLSQTVTGSVKSCGCNQQAGSVLDGAAPSLSCKCDASTGHAGQPGACFCDSSTGHFGYPGFCMCNFNLQFVGSAGSCKNCAALNAHASQFNGAYFCRCNGDSGYGSPDASGTCRICASGNSVVQVDSQGQFQCVACAATEKVVKNMCVGA
ncbi:Hypothetical_protein [Hexamita inflata]|uniref:Hypothetical_protein n=1 Tax=Hexamita inflata TaxID=28002 RepID=A0AA86NPL7_9EUKA|nr:Hypothetical protein HINF_LOCUS10478 [Hexamita inflata]